MSSYVFLVRKRKLLTKASIVEEYLTGQCETRVSATKSGVIWSGAVRCFDVFVVESPIRGQSVGLPGTDEMR